MALLRLHLRSFKMPIATPNRFYFFHEFLNDEPLNQDFNEEAGILEVPFTSSLFLPYLVNATSLRITDNRGMAILDSTNPNRTFTMFDIFDIKKEDRITPEELVSLPHTTLWEKARKILSGLKMVSAVEEEQAESDSPEYSEERNHQNCVLSISGEVLKQVGDTELCLSISYNDEAYQPFGTAAYYIVLPLVWHATPLKRHGTAYYYPTVKVKAITDTSLITRWPTIDPTVGKATELTRALEAGDVDTVIKQVLFTKETFTSDVLEAVIDQCKAYPMFNFEMLIPNTQYMSVAYGTMFNLGTNRRKLLDVEDNPDAKPGYVFKFDYDRDNHLHLYLVRLNKATMNEMTDDPSYELHDLGIIYNTY